MNIKSYGATSNKQTKKNEASLDKILNFLVMILSVGLMIFAAASPIVTGFVALILFIMGWWAAEDRYNKLFKDN